MEEKKYLNKEGLEHLVGKIRSALDSKQAKGDYVTLEDGKIPSSLLPTYVDDIVEFKGIVETGTLKYSSAVEYDHIAYIADQKKFVAVQIVDDDSSIGIGGVKPKTEVYYPNWPDRDNYADELLVPHSGKFFVDTETNKTYRWSGSDLVEISSSLAIGTTEGTAYSGKEGAANRALIEGIMEGDKPLATPVIGASWKLQTADGQEITLPSQTNLTTDYGYTASFTGTFRWTKDEQHKAPTAVAGGDWSGKALPESGVNSEAISVTGITSDRTFTAKVSAPKQGLVMVNNIIRKADASDLDYTSASARVHFQYKCLSGATTEAEPTAETLQTKLGSTSAVTRQDSKAKTLTGVTTSGSSYYMYAYPALLGDLTKIVMNDATPLLDGGFTLRKVTVTDPETKKQLEYNVYTSVQRGAFTNAKLVMA